ncbi:peptidase dimerization domain-containing protein, partial [Pseudomonas aeruginosa]|uniref:peptidase dimerization domain-containing protein n=1 Tax=Pseudomonas aeruginosa TaxID=287 RepID=UPI003CC660C5
DGLVLFFMGRSSEGGSAPEQGRNAILELSHQLLRLMDLGDPAKGTTLTWTLARGGEKRNIIRAEASAEADMGYSDPA